MSLLAAGFASPRGAPRSLQHLELSVSPLVKGGDPEPCTREPGGISERQNWKYLKICLSSSLKGNMQGQENPSLDRVLEKKCEISSDVSPAPIGDSIYSLRQYILLLEGLGHLLTPTS